VKAAQCEKLGIRSPAFRDTSLGHGDLTRREARPRFRHMTGDALYGIILGDECDDPETRAARSRPMHQKTLTLYEHKVGGRALDRNFGRTLVYPA